jgi:hypothetical protein
MALLLNDPKLEALLDSLHAQSDACPATAVPFQGGFELSVRV